MNKNIKNFINYFLGPLLFLWLAFSIYNQIVHQPGLARSWTGIKASLESSRIFALIAAMMLIFFNWGLEAYKWQVSLKKVYPVNFLTAFKAVLSGVSFSVTMPNRVGEYLGRIMYLPEGNRLRIISVTLAGSFAQLLITLWMGLAGTFVLKARIIQAYPQFSTWYTLVLYGLLLIVALSTLLYAHIGDAVALFHRWFKTNRYLYLVESLRNFNGKLLAQLILISFLRYGIFLLQYSLLFYLFEVNVPVVTEWWVMSVVFLAMAVIPSIALVEVGMRGEISLKLMGIFTANSLGIGLTSITVWFINLILPAIAGSLLLLNIKVFTRRNERT